MDRKVSLEAMLHLAAVELDELEYQEFKELEHKKEFEKPSEELTEKLQFMMNKEKKADNFLNFRKNLSKVAVIVMMSFSLLSMSFLSASAVRESVANVILEWYDGFTRIFMINEDIKTTIGDVQFSYVTEGFEMIYSDEEISNIKTYKFEDSSGWYFDVNLLLSDKNNVLNTDNDRLKYHNIIIDDISGLWAESDGYNKFIISKEGITYNISGYINLSEIIKIYESIVL